MKGFRRLQSVSALACSGLLLCLASSPYSVADTEAPTFASVSSAHSATFPDGDGGSRTVTWVTIDIRNPHVLVQPVVANDALCSIQWQKDFTIQKFSL